LRQSKPCDITKTTPTRGSTACSGADIPPSSSAIWNPTETVSACRAHMLLDRSGALPLTSAPETCVGIARDHVKQRAYPWLRLHGFVAMKLQVASHPIDGPRLLARAVLEPCVHSGPYSGLHGGRHSQIVTELPAVSTSIRILSCTLGGTLPAA